MIGREMDVLLEKPGRVAGQMVGRSPWLLPVIIDDNQDRIGDIIHVKITSTGTNSLIAQNWPEGMMMPRQKISAY